MSRIFVDLTQKPRITASIDAACNHGTLGETEHTTDHALLVNRDAEDQHPVSAITGLQAFVDLASVLHNTGDGTGFLSDDGTYKQLHGSEPDTVIPSGKEITDDTLLVVDPDAAPDKIPEWYSGTQIMGTGDSITAVISGSAAGDYYLNTATGCVYYALGDDTWSYQTCLKGKDAEAATAENVTVADNENMFISATVEGALEELATTVDGLINAPDVNLAAGVAWQTGYYKGITGDYASSPTFICTSEYIPVKPGQTYCVQDFMSAGNDVALFKTRGKFTDDADVFVEDIAYANVSGDSDIFYVTVPNGAKRMYLNAWYSSVSDSAKVKVTLIKYYLCSYRSENTAIFGKRWASLGDSITYQEKWQPYLCAKHNLIHTNCGIGSTCLAGEGTANLPPFWNADRLSRVMGADPDIVTILGGANDLVSNIPIGDASQLSAAVSEKDKNTFIGAYSYIIETLLAWKPALKIVILGTTWAHMDGKDYSDTVTYTDYSNAGRMVAGYYGLPFVDLHGNCGFNQFTMDDAPYDVYSGDHIHPNDAGGKIIASLVDKVFDGLFRF